MSDYENKHLLFSDILMIQPNKKQSEDDEEEEDKLSFCDLPIYTNATEWVKYSSSSTTSTNSLSTTSFSEEEEAHHFRFFTEEWTNKAAVSNPPDNIVFCGKILQQKLVPANKQQPSPGNSRIPEKKIRRLSGGGLLRFFRTMKKKSDDIQLSGESDNSSCNAISRARNYYSSAAAGEDFPNLSMMRSSPSGRSKWYLIFFGFSRVPTEMELRDIKNRSRRKITTLSGRVENGVEENAAASVSEGDGASRKVWRLIRALSCGGSHHSLLRSVGVDGLGFPART